MGAINSAFNQAAVSVATATAAVGHLKDQDVSQALLGKEQYHEAKADLTKLQGEQAEASKALANANKAYDETSGWNLTGKNKAMLQGKINKRLSEKEAAQRAFDELTDKIEARKAVMSRAEIMMRKANKWGGLR